jgi:hypothetical protein
MWDIMWFMLHLHIAWFWTSAQQSPQGIHGYLQDDQKDFSNQLFESILMHQQLMEIMWKVSLFKNLFLMMVRVIPSLGEQFLIFDKNSQNNIHIWWVHSICKSFFRRKGNFEQSYTLKNSFSIGKLCFYVFL